MATVKASSLNINWFGIFGSLKVLLCHAIFVTQPTEISSWKQCNWQLLIMINFLVVISLDSILDFLVHLPVTSVPFKLQWDALWYVFTVKRHEINHLIICHCFNILTRIILPIFLHFLELNIEWVHKKWRRKFSYQPDFPFLFLLRNIRLILKDLMKLILS